MDRDATFLLSLVTFAVAAIAVGACGWLLWSRSRGDAAPQRPPVDEES